MLLQHKIALSALICLFNRGKSPTIVFNPGTQDFFVDGNFFDYTIAEALESKLQVNDIPLLQKAKVQLNENPMYCICGGNIIKAGNFQIENLNSVEGFAFHNLVCFRTIEDAQQALELAIRLTEALDGKDQDNVTIQMIKVHPDAKDPKIAYGGTSAAFDLAAIEDIRIQPNTDAVVPVGLKLSIDQNQPYYMQVHMRSSYGFKHGIQCHQGIIDAGYTGDFGIKVFNRTKFPIEIKKGDYFAQVVVHKKPTIQFKELNPKQWDEYENQQLRGSGGFGSSGK